MCIYDISVPISARIPTYPGDPQVEIGQWLALADGDPANVSLIRFGAHTGTHVDAPAHFIEGALKLDALPLEILIGEVLVVEIPPDRLSIAEDFVAANCPAGTPRLLFKSRNSNFWSDMQSGFQTDYTYIEPAAANRLVRQGVRLVGVDYLSVERFGSQGYETHHTLLGNGVVIVEGLDLRGISAGTYELLCLPLRIAGGGGDGAPARAVLRSIDCIS